jgi:hypothetical protein
MWHEPPHVTGIIRGGRGRVWFMRRLIALTAYITMVALGVSFVLGFLLHGGRGIMFATGAFLACFGTYLVWTDFFRRTE